MAKRISLSEEAILEGLNAMSKGSLMETLGIRFTRVGYDTMQAEMAVTEKISRTMGLLHGGANLALIETIGGAASTLFIDNDTQMIVGLEIASNHIKMSYIGDVMTAEAKPLHLGRTTHLWEVRVVNQKGQLISVGKVTNMVLPRKF